MMIVGSHRLTHMVTHHSLVMQDLLEEVARLAKEGSFDYLIIESTGVTYSMAWQ